MKKASSQGLKWAGGALDFSLGPLVMGVLNVTPDSFSDGGLFLDVDRAVEQGQKLVSEGAAIIDVGAESTRPGSNPVSTEEQIRRAIPVIEALSKTISIPISIDTSKVDVAEAAMNAGAAIINDITALADDDMAELASEAGVPVVLMHMQGRPKTMQQEPEYGDVVNEVIDMLTDRAEKAEHFGIPRNHIFLDPGIGFGKTLAHNLTLLRSMERFVATGYRILIGTSRKRFIGAVCNREKPEDRVFGTAATVAYCAEHGASILRVHDVGAMVDVVKMVTAIKHGVESPN